MYRCGASASVVGFVMFLIPSMWTFGAAMVVTAIGAALLVPAYTLFATEKQSGAPGAAAGYIAMSHTLGYGVASMLAFTSTLNPQYPIYLCVLCSALIFVTSYVVKREGNIKVAEQA